MIVLALGPLLIGVLAAGFGPHLARRMAPAPAAVLLTALALSVALAVGAMLCLAAIIGLKLGVPALRPSDWSTSAVREVIPLPPVLGILAGVVAAGLVMSACVHAVRVALGLWRAGAAARSPAVRDGDNGDNGDNGIALVEDDQLFAYAVPGRSGRVVISSGLVRSVSEMQRRAVVEHELSHLRHRHYVYAQLVRLAASANPLVRRLVPAVDVALERWADADAASAVGSPRLVAHTLGAVALSTPATPGLALGVAEHAVLERARFLLEPPPRRTGLRAAVVALALSACWLVTVVAAIHVHGLVEAAEAAYRP